MVRAGEEIQVLDARTGEDLTRVVLTQIILEDAKEKPGLPLELLYQLIKASDRAGHEFINWLAISPLNLMKNLLGGTPTQSPVEAELEELRRRVAEMEERLKQPGPKPRRKRH
jgi:hypothetical protein